MRYDGAKITLGGVEYTAPPLTGKGLRKASELMRLAERMKGESGDGKGAADAMDAIADMVDLGAEVIHCSLARNYPDISLEDVKDAVSLEEIWAVLPLLLGVSGYALPKATPGQTGAP